MSSPTQRSLKWFRDKGCLAAVVEKWIPFPRPQGTRIDLFGIIDALVLEPSKMGVLGVQVTSGTNVSSRVEKARQNETLPLWLACGNRFEVHGWRKIGERGKRKLWAIRRLIGRLEAGVIQFEDVEARSLEGA